MKKVISDNYLKPEVLKDGYLYRINARNALYGIWSKLRGEFIISRFKFGHNFLFVEVHWDLSDDFGTVKPLELVEKAPFNPVIFRYYSVVRLRGAEVLNYLNQFKLSDRQITGKQSYSFNQSHLFR